MASWLSKAICLTLLLPATSAPAASESSRANILAFLKSSRIEGVQSRWDFAYASLPPIKQAPPITIVYLTNQGWCGADGSGGCDLLILATKSGRYHLIGDLSVKGPITLIGRAEDGYPIFGAMTGALKPKKGKYPEVAYASHRLSSQAHNGRTLISEATITCNFRRLPPGRECQRLRDTQSAPDARLGRHSTR